MDVDGIKLQDYYFEEQAKHANIYGDKTIVFMHVGTFYEAYCRLGTDQGYQDLEQVEKCIDFKFVKRENTGPNSKPSMLGIPRTSIANKLSILVKHGYTIVLFDQYITDHKKSGIGRKKVGVFSPGTHFDDMNLTDTNYMLSVYISEEKQLRSLQTLLAIGLTILDVTTGYSMVHEFYGDTVDEKFGLDELARIMTMFRPSESVFYFHPVESHNDKQVKDTIESIKTYVELNKYTHHFYTYRNKKGTDNMNLISADTFKIPYQNDYLTKIYNLTDQATLGRNQSTIEILALERKPYATISLIMILNYVSRHNINLLKNLSFPTIYIYSKHLILENNAIEQLNVIDSNNLESYNSRFQSLFDVVDKTSTPMGKRLLKENLLNPFSQENKSAILERYSWIDAFIANDFYVDIHDELKNIFDVHRLHRKMAMGSITPYELYRLDTFYRAMTKIFGKLRKHKEFEKLVPIATIKQFIAFQKSLHDEFIFDELQKYNSFSDIIDTFFKPGVYPQIDKLQNKIVSSIASIDAIIHYFDKLSPKFKIKMNNTTHEGYYLTVVKSQEKYFKETIRSCPNPIRITTSTGDVLKIDTSRIHYKSLPKSRTKIFIDVLESDVLGSLRQKLVKKSTELFTKYVVDRYSKNREMLVVVTQLIATIDFLVSGAIVACKYTYCKPQIPSDENIPSYFNAHGLRHGLGERLISETEYIPTDIALGNVPDVEKKDNGIFLLGVNAAGKSNLMKSIGLAIILAQIGYYVPATSFVYEPYMSLFTRITGNDNILKGLSSYALEMVELDAIINRTVKNGKNTLVIGDEVCRGTDQVSAATLVASTLIHLSKHNATFIFSSHLHNIPAIPEIAQIPNLGIYHLRVEFDKDRNCLVYDRKLISGTGPNLYGLMVARFMIKNSEFLHIVESIKGRLVPDDAITIPTRVSKYNNSLVMTHCAICFYRPLSDHHKELDTHHINFQKDCWKNGKIKVKPHLSKDELYNLVVLCRKCHEKVHRNVITIRGYLDTSRGPLLSYKVDVVKDTLDALNKKY